MTCRHVALGFSWLPVAVESATGRAAAEILVVMNVRRLAAIDMYGARGTIRRQRLILAEFLLGAAVSVGFGTWLLLQTSNAAGQAIALWILGVGLNYAPLAAYAIALSRPGVLNSELAGVDTGRELRRYSVQQLWVFVPLSLVAFAAREVLTRHS